MAILEREGPRIAETADVDRSAIEMCLFCMSARLKLFFPGSETFFSRFLYLLYLFVWFVRVNLGRGEGSW